jgi:hypothetical protein
MALAGWAQFKGVTNVEHDQYAQNLFYGTQQWLNWSALQVGAFQNISHSNASGVLGGDFSRLRLARDPRYTSGQVWETFRSDLVWETGVSFSPSPTKMSGVYVNGSWYGTAESTGTAYEHYIDYHNGRVVFASAISTSTVVKSDFAHRTMSFVDANEPWFQELLYNSFRIDRADFLAAGSGQWDQLSEIKRQLPACGLELVSRRGYRPYQLGGGQWIDQDMLVYICTEHKRERDQWLDILSMQNDRTINLLNRKRMKEDSGYPHDLDYRGMTVDNPMQYPQLAAPTGQGGFLWTNVELNDTVGEVIETVNGWLHRAVVRMTFTIILPYI